MTSLNESLSREIIRQSVNVQRFEGTVRKAALSELVRLDKVLVGLLAQGGPNAKLSNLLTVAKQEIDVHLSAAKQAALKDSERLIKATAAQQAKAINVVTGSELATVIVSDAFVAVTLSKATVMGAPAAQHWTRQKARTYQRFADTTRNGFLTGRTTQQITRDWMQQSGQLRRQAETLVRTSVQSQANAARHQFYERNQNVVRGMQALVTLDVRTSGLCRSRSGMAWDFEGNPLNEITTQPWPGPPPWHYGCRTTLIAVLKEFSELNPSDKRKVPVGMQASMDGQVAGDLTYDDWFQGLTEEQQIEVLGPAKHRLYKKNKLTMRDMVDQDGNTLTIDELEETLK